MDPTETRFSLLDLDDPTAPAARARIGTNDLGGPRAHSPGCPDDPPTPSIIDPNHARLDASAEVQRASVFGFRETPLYGQALIASGVAAYNESRKEVESWPEALPAAHAHAVHIAQELRIDKDIELPALKMLPDGRITRDGNGIYPLTPYALKDLARVMEIPGGASYLPAIPAPDRADHLNRIHFPAAYRQDARASEAQHRKVMVPRTGKVRTRVNRDTQREIWAVVGSRYKPFDSDVFVTTFAESCPPGARVEVKYDGYRTRVQALWYSREVGESHRVGEVYKAGLAAETADDGSAAATFWSIVYQSLCVNLTTATLRKRRGRQRHIVDAATFRDVTREAVGRSAEDVRYWREAWNDATVDNVLDRYSLTDPEDVIAGLVYSKAIWVPGVKPEILVERLKRAWDFSPGYTKSSFVDAVTRAAHTEDWQDPWTVEALQDTAGDLLYAQVWQVPEGLQIAEDARA